MLRVLVPILVVALALPARAEEPVAKPAQKAETAPLSVADQNGLRSCLWGGCACGAGQCANGEPVKGALVGAVAGALALVGAGLTIGLLNPPPDGNREPRAGQLTTLTVVNLSLVAVWVWSLADAYGTGRANALEAGAPTTVVKTDSPAR